MENKDISMFDILIGLLKNGSISFVALIFKNCPGKAFSAICLASTVNLRISGFNCSFLINFTFRLYDII